MVDNLAELLTRAAERDPDGVALVHAGARVTWGALDARVTAFARGALARGLRRGDRVGIALANRTELVVAHSGAMRAGLVSVLLNPLLTSHELTQRTHDTRPTLVVCDTTSEVAVREALVTNHIGTEVVVPVGSAAWGDLMRPDHPAAEPARTDPESIAELMFTGGIDGHAQAVMLSHRALAAALRGFGELDPAPLAAGDTLLLSLPLVHSIALNAVLGLAIEVGATVLLERRADPDESFDIVVREGATVVAAPAALLTAWAGRDDADALRGVRLLALMQGSLAPSVAAQLRTATGQPVWAGYGMAESGALITCTAGHTTAPGSVGAPVPGVEMVLLDNGGQPAYDDDPGEVMVRGDSLLTGYWPDAGGGPDADGWFATRDVGYLDDDGDLHLLDRRNDLIIVNGFPVYPREVEAVLAELGDVAECVVMGVDHPGTGQAVCALLVASPGATPDIDAALAHCAARLARHKCPTIVEVVEELPHTDSGAVERYRLRALT